MSTLGDVMDGITNLIDDDGYYAFENHYIMEILEKLQYDTFYHEHLRTYSLLSLIKLFEMYNLCLFDAQIVSRYGGSIRCIVSKKERKKTDFFHFIFLTLISSLKNSTDSSSPTLT